MACMRRNQNADLRKPEILENFYRVMIKEGIEGSSISKIANRLDIHPSLILHYFKSKDNMKLELVELLIKKFESRQMIDVSHIEDLEERFSKLMDILFSFQWSRTVDPGVHFGFYYLSFRDQRISKRFKTMFVWLRDYLTSHLADFNRAGIICVSNEKKAADYIVTVMEGLEFHAQFLAGDHPFEEFAQTAKNMVVHGLKTGGFK